MFLSFYFLIDLFLSSFCFQSMIGHCLGAARGWKPLLGLDLRSRMQRSSPVEGESDK